MKSKQLLITVYFETDQNDLVLDHNTDDDYDYDSNRELLVSEVTVLPTEPQPLPINRKVFASH